ncbi:ATP-dependent protease ATP-binding subunit ClpX [Campylobacter coli]|nr:ATP-dependent protease ATP-binding subunit ClpX [Campylobacter coli]
MPRKCSFCNEVENPQRRILANENDDAFICEYCVEGLIVLSMGKKKNLKSQNMNMALILKILPQKN